MKLLLRSDYPVKTIHPLFEHSPKDPVKALSTALSEGVFATPDPKRPGFYDVVIGDVLYYILKSSRTRHVYLVGVSATT